MTKIIRKIGPSITPDNHDEVRYGVINGWEIIEMDQHNPDEVFIHLKDEDGGEYKGIITGVMD